jgi:hypothetical protein
MPTVDDRNSHFFIYGTLLDCDILSCVLNREISNEQIIAAKAPGFQKYVYPGDSYPVLVSRATEAVTGGLLAGLSNDDLKRIRFYEGDEYEFGTLTVENANGHRQPALFNKATDDERHSDEIWCLETWQHREKASFMIYCQRYMALYGTMSIEQADAVWREMVDGTETMAAS